MRNTDQHSDNKQAPARPHSEPQGQPGNMAPEASPQPDDPGAPTGQTIGDTAGEGGDHFDSTEEPALTGTAGIRGARKDEDAARRRR
jgi:hypothetical protein